MNAKRRHESPASNQKGQQNLEIQDKRGNDHGEYVVAADSNQPGIARCVVVRKHRESGRVCGVAGGIGGHYYCRLPIGNYQNNTIMNISTNEDR